MTNLTTIGLGLIAALTPTAGYTAVVVDTLVLSNEATLGDATKLGIAGVMVMAVTVPLVTWVLRRLEKVSDALVKSKEEKHSEEMLAVKDEIKELRALIEKLRPSPPPA